MINRSICYIQILHICNSSIYIYIHFKSTCSRYAWTCNLISFPKYVVSQVAVETSCLLTFALMKTQRALSTLAVSSTITIKLNPHLAFCSWPRAGQLHHEYHRFRELIFLVKHTFDATTVQATPRCLCKS